MTHEQLREQLSAFVDEELGVAEAAAVAEHLEACEPCRLEVDELGGAIRAMRSLAGSQAPEGFSETLRKTIRTRSKGRFYATGDGVAPSRWLSFDLIAVVMLIVLISVALVFLVPDPVSPKLIELKGGRAVEEAPPPLPSTP